jgi:hypothetical protein
MDTRGVEVVNFNALGGTDRVSVGDLTATDVTNVNVDLAGVLGGSAGDGAVDSVTVNGTNGDDNVNVTGNGAGADITGLATTVSVAHADRPDVLLVNTLPGNDHVSVNGVLGMQLFVNGKPV